MKESIKIILRIYNSGAINEDEAIQLIEDIYSKNTTTYPYTPYWPQITYNTPDFSCNKIE